jgi:hypothetical protein
MKITRSRLKELVKEEMVTERLRRFKVYVSGEKEPLILMGKNEKEVKQTAYAMIRNSSVKIRKVVKEIAVKKDKEGKMAKFDAKETYQDAVDVFKMIDEYDDLPEWLEAKITKASDYMNSVKDYLTHHHSGKNEGKINEDWRTEKNAWSSKEAKKIMDDSLRLWSKDLKQVKGRVVKDWMSKAKAGVLDFFDIEKGMTQGDVSRAHPKEVELLHNLLTRDKIMNRFRSYFGGKKAMNNRLSKKRG